MKVGDIVRQHGNFVKGNLKTNTKTLGVVLEIKEFPKQIKKSKNRRIGQKCLVAVLLFYGVAEKLQRTSLKVR